MKTSILVPFTLLIGLAAGFFIAGTLPLAPEAMSESSAEEKPLYWVAPMDANYQRDKPGLSPMGMALVPVYADDLGGDDAPGTVTIRSEVVNNLGVKTEAVLFSPLQAQIHTVGYVAFNQDQVIDLHPRISGWIKSVAVNAPGEYVEKGSLLYAIYSPELVNAQEEFVAASKRNNRFLVAASEQKLKALGVAQRFIDQLKTSKKVREQVPVYADQSGYVGELNLRKGMFVKPGMKLMSTGPLDQVWVIAEVFERQAHQLDEGDSVEMKLDYLPGKTWTGRVDYIYPVLDNKTRTLQVRLRFDNPELLLKPDMFASVTIFSRPTAPLLSVPAASVIVTGEQERVVVALGEGRYKAVAVTTGGRFSDRIAILAGLYPEDWVVTSAQFLLDSESSLSSDFLRMTPSSMGQVDDVWVMAEIKHIDQQTHMATLAHQAIREWTQPAMTMEVPVMDGLDISRLAAGDLLQVQLKGGRMAELQIVDFILPRPKAPRSNVGGGL